MWKTSNLPCAKLSKQGPMRHIFRVLRALLVTVIVVPLILPVIVYVALSFDGVKRHVAQKAQTELTRLLGTPVSIGRVDFAPFNRILLGDVSVADSLGRPILTVGHLGAGVSYTETLIHRRPVVTYAELIDVSLALSRDSAGAPLNIEPIIARFKKSDGNSPSSFDLSVNMVVIRRSSLTYDQLDTPRPEEGRFDPTHIAVTGIRADLSAPRISDSLFHININRMGASERSGLTLTQLAAEFSISRHDAKISNLTFRMPQSRITLDDFTIPSPMSESFSERLKAHTWGIATLSDSHIALADLAPLLPAGMSTEPIIDIELEADGPTDRVTLHRLNLIDRVSGAFVSAHGSVTGLSRRADSLMIDLPRLSVDFSAPMVLQTLGSVNSRLAALSGQIASLSALGHVNLLTSVTATHSSIDANGTLSTDCGEIDIDAGIIRHGDARSIDIDGHIKLMDFNPSALHPSLQQLTELSAAINGEVTIGADKRLSGSAKMEIPNATWKGERFHDIVAEAVADNNSTEFNAESHSPKLDFTISGRYDSAPLLPATELFAHIRNIDLGLFLAKGRFSQCNIRGGIDAAASGLKPDDISGWTNITDLTLEMAGQEEYNAGDINIELSHADSLRTINITNRALDISLAGDYTFASLGQSLHHIAAQLFPALTPPLTATSSSDSLITTARLSINLHADTIISRIFKLPVDIIHPGSLRAATDGRSLSLNLDLPYLRQKDKLIEGTSLNLNASTSTGNTTLTARTIMPTKNGPMTIDLLTRGLTDSLDTKIKWKIDREHEYSGNLSAGTVFKRKEDGSTLTNVDFRNTQLIFNDTVWQVRPSVISISPNLITVRDFGGYRQGQSLSINGTASPDSLSRVVVDLDHIDLDYVFETLAISDAVVFGGTATGRFYGDGLLSSSPVLYTPQLHVDALSYNHCVMGDADIVSWWDNNTKQVTIKADVNGHEGAKSVIDGYIRPMTEELVFDFTADRAPVGFMLPFMIAFTSEISGLVSGNAHLYGTFKDLDIKGKIFVEDMNMRLDFTNTTYSVTDSVTLNPGHISFSDVTLTDKYGNTAMLSGEVRHKYFHDPTFLFNISDARNMLVYDVGENDTPDPWYGRIFGRGGATVRGIPGRIDIGVDMISEPGSTFTFIISDAEESVDYDFITFHDRDKARKDSIAALDPTPLIVRQLRAKAGANIAGPPSRYVMDLNVDIRPDATLNLVMDPIGGDKIMAHGSGALNMRYDSQGELEMRGDYTLNNGFYRFTLQDIVVKDFTIRDGSSIRFSGDPYSAQLDIIAAHSTTANLTDLDQSFQSDPELNRTNVKVNAIMKVKGDMRSPEIGYDLEFPSLNSDIDRKVKSIVSTDEMMGQQIIYLLALNRFYTPEYMSATRGNDLVSVASSTLSSRLGSMLGAISDDWNIAPAIRSSKGDFSDVEVDLALSSQLLDNRLLLNGNFGYRDKSLNNNSFIGDFDIRYLLNRAGTIQLKAYNRYNDQNYYLKSALTTQGIGIVFKRDFDNIFSFLRPVRRWLRQKKVHTDSTTTISQEELIPEQQ